jgi:DNA-binding LytR/AlgR family response regulator
LLKPYSKERFLAAVKKAQKELALEKGDSGSHSHLTLRADFKLNNIPLDSILLIEALDDYVQVHLEDGKKIVARSTMKSILDKLPESDFKRAHRSFIVPMKKIQSIYKDVITVHEFTIPISTTYKDEILKNLNI